MRSTSLGEVKINTVDRWALAWWRFTCDAVRFPKAHDKEFVTSLMRRIEFKKTTTPSTLYTGFSNCEQSKL